MAAEQARITLDPNVLAGKPVIRGTRLSVEFVIGLMADGWNEADILANYPGISHDDIIACLAYARDALSSEKVFPILLTFDKDFGEVARVTDLPATYGVLLFRIAAPPAGIGQRLAALVMSRDDWIGHFSVVEPGRIRMRSLG
jgi:uncharacterized protein (DUF433 family)